MSQPTDDEPHPDGPPTPDQPTHPQVHLRLTGTDGNVYSIIGRIAAALRREVNNEAASAFTQAAFACGSYDEVLRLAMVTIDVG